VWNVAELDPSRLHGPVEVTELYQRLIPYRTHRTVLQLDSHEDYEMTLLRLLAGERGYAFVEPEEARAALVQEASAVNPDTGLYKRYGAAKVTFDPEHVREALGGEDTPRPAPDREAAAGAAPAPPPVELPWFPEPPPDAPEIEEPRAADEPAAEQPELPFALDEGAAAEPAPEPRTASAPCAFCGGALPVGRAVIFCPHCGQNVGVVHCPSCGTELDVGWRFCITCGRQMMGLA